MTKAHILLAALAVSLSSFVAHAQTKTESVETFLPRESVTNATYFEIEPDPGLNDYGRRIQAAQQKNAEWFRDYALKHRAAGNLPLPYHENFGVTKKEYEHFIHPTNHVREIKRQEIKMRRSSPNGLLRFDLLGENLLLSRIELDLKAETAKTPLDLLPKLSFVDLKTASLPPAAHRGVLFRTPDARITETKRRESLLIGELVDKSSGIIHYSVNSPGQVKMIYIKFAK